MKSISRFLLAAVFAGIALMGLVGCGGPAPGLNPTVTFTYPDGEPISTIPSGSSVLIQGDAAVADETQNPITSIEWSTVPAGVGTFTTPDSLETTWVAPEVSAPLQVTLLLTVKTLLGGETTKHINLTVVPTGVAF